LIAGCATARLAPLEQHEEYRTVARSDIAYAQARERIRQLESAMGDLAPVRRAAAAERRDELGDGGDAAAADRLAIAHTELTECARAIAQDRPHVARQLQQIAVQAEKLAGQLSAERSAG
jgi:putative component of toxin-antitoxin plasmid stabilization module